ncbi:RHS repeat domain-containing protein [Hoylesella timonensis]|uniref:RHS repeat domain-containing protein n=1 Tax=Hoylesella timonensis TaxID=386414 RepID=UPI00288A8494|nr:RHS repeat-associated core domain-containing protein [Hoylesella timonensis]
MGSIAPPQATNVAMTLKTDYCGNMIYENGKLSKILTDVGYITLNSGGEPPLYHYFLQDHLGNNRMVVQENGAVEQINHYYAFGGLMGESSGGEMQPYKYNGKELDRMHGLDWYDYGARHYDAALARWMCMDPLTEKYYDVSPYAYCGNNPVNAIDPDRRKLALTSNITMSLATIQSTLPQSLRSYVRLQDGYIDLKFLEKGLSTMNGNISGNYQALYNIVSDSRTVEFSITDKPNAVNASGSPSTGVINFGPTEFFPDDNLGNKAEWVTQGGTGISLAPKSHQFTQWDKLNRNKLSNDQQQFSPNENYQIQINSSMFNNKATYKYGAIATTHELYGHILFMLMG